MQTYDTHPREGEAQPAEKVFMFEFSCLARKYELYFININTLLKTENSKINFQKGVKSRGVKRIAFKTKDEIHTTTGISFDLYENHSEGKREGRTKVGAGEGRRAGILGGAYREMHKPTWKDRTAQL